MVIASIDLMNGKAVQLKQGREKVLEKDSPVELARYFNRFGEIAVIDLDAAMQQGDNQDTIRELLKIAECRIGGGIRTVEDARYWISLGATKVIVGSVAFQDDRINKPFLEKLAESVTPQRVIIAVDSLNGEIVTRGWKHRTGLKVYEILPELEPYAAEFLFTCVEKEGMMQGVDLEAIKRVKRLTNRKITAAGGITSLEEVRKLAEMEVDVQVGMALYTGKLALEDAFIHSLNWKQTLLPTIVRDTSGRVLMLAYSNKASLKKTFDTNRMWYYSRSRQKLWQKGETSGNIQHLKKLRVDCDRDTILATVDQENVACHTGSYSCFGGKEFRLEDLYKIVMQRLIDSPEGSYTARLKDESLLKSKIMEEAQEVIEAETREEVIWEVADVLYFLTVYLASKKVTPEEVLRELNRRRWG
ncbi:MAG: bifunctional phosphoribosyl-AMP cyclohydrolase/phosphoribosyl-ATP diphosphatase HisIE [Calditrichaeota bacterium]|nr:MAG: bifunctional phosphoribosyl-AMP cyclohydrolase/phosphoribosyl-ATP diphosphatase HisIE [Calditrichota bacterium]